MSRACVRVSHTTGRDKLILSCADDLISSFVVSCDVVSCACVSTFSPTVKRFAIKRNWLRSQRKTVQIICTLHRYSNIKNDNRFP